MENFIEQIRNKQVSLDDAILAIKRLRVHAEIAEAHFIRVCMALEESGMWREGAAAKDVTFTQFLKRACGVDPGRYEAGSAGLRDAQLAPLAPMLGMAAIKELVKVEDPQLRVIAINNLEKSAVEGGSPIPSRTAASIVGKVVGPKVRPPSLLEISLCEAEKQLAAARLRIAELEAENASLREQLGIAQKVATQKPAVAKSKKGKKGHHSQAHA